MIRKINNNDFHKIYELGTKYNNKFSNIYNLEQYINNSIYIMNCYEDKQDIKGFVIATKLYDTVEILLIYVDEKYRQQNIGTELIKSLEIDSVKTVLLEVSVENIPAISLYKKMGYAIITTRKKYYKGIDAYIMKKVLK